MASQRTRDFFMAYDMHEKLNCLGVTENVAQSGKENYRPQTLIDKTLELIDPTPNIHTLFVQFNARFFWNVLLPVEVKWSNRMTSCAGVCTFHRRNKQCVISLSAPLLKLRPRKDLIETLLHEMIHGYLFLTNNDRDRDGHGPNFCKHMHRINQEAGTNITIYHNFHDEVKLYQQHWWKCNGPCQYRPPFFGTVRRAMNRAPGPSDYWWYEHQQNCNGQFIKIREPENFKSRSKQNDKSTSISKDNKPNKSIANWFTKNSSTIVYKPVSITANSKVFTQKNSKTFTQINRTNVTTSNNNNNNNNSDSRTNSPHIVNDKNKNQDLLLGMKKLGSTSNKVHGWGIGGPGENIDNTRNVISKSPKFKCSGTVGGSNSGRSNLLTKFLHTSDNKKNRHPNKSPRADSASKLPSTIGKSPIDKSLSDLNQPKNRSVSCPICDASVFVENINKHMDLCLMSDDETKREISNDSKRKTMSTSSVELNDNGNSPIRTFFTPLVKRAENDTLPKKRLKSDDSSGDNRINCPVCNKMLPSADINWHLDECLLESDTARKTSVPSNSRISNDDSIISISNSSSSSFSSSDLDDSVVLESPNTRSRIIDIGVGNNDKMKPEQKCLVCNAQIAPEMSLSEHLEECIGAVFNDDMIIVDDENDVPVAENNSTDKYPCPVCMQMLTESLMNQHLDMCLQK